MNGITLEKIAAELASRLVGQRFGKIFNLTRFDLTFDFRLPASEYLFVSIEPGAPRVYLIERRVRDLEKQSKNPTAFVMFLRKRLAHSVLESVEKMAGERVLRFALRATGELGATENYTLVAQLTGRSANLLLLDENDFVLDAARETHGAGQEIASRYAPPAREETMRRKTPDEEIFPRGDYKSLSAALDAFYTRRETEKDFQTRVGAARAKLKQKIAKRKKLAANLNRDLANHGEADEWKRFGDLLLANLATAERSGAAVLVTDYFDENAPTIAIPVDENAALTEAAEKFFKRYTKARNARAALSERLIETERQIEDLRTRSERLERAIAEKDEEFLADSTGAKAVTKPSKAKDKPAESFTGARRYASTDGFEILVGKGSKDNDFLTFRVAKSNDLWLHAADYPGSHVVVKNPNRREIPMRTVLEAAQIAAFFSRAKEQPKVAVNYTEKKHVNKPKGAAPGLVSLSSFKTILVEPKPIESGK